jgi:hypothetical protein
MGLIGTGLSLANGSTVTVSGGDITVSSAAFGGGAMFVEIVVPASATLGPRTVTVTNANLDTSVLSGGLIVK